MRAKTTKRAIRLLTPTTRQKSAKISFICTLFEHFCQGDDTFGDIGQPFALIHRKIA